MVVSMRPIAEAQVDLVRELSSRYTHAHGAPIHIGDPGAIGINDLDRPDYGAPVPGINRGLAFFMRGEQAAAQRCFEVSLRSSLRHSLQTDLAYSFLGLAATAASIKQKRGRPVMGVMAVNQNPIEI